VEGHVERRRKSRLFAFSYDGCVSPSISLHGYPAGAVPAAQALEWGFTWYPSQQPAALVLKDTGSIAENALTKVLREWDRFESDLFLCHIRGAPGRNTESDTQPFVRSHAGRDWVLLHAGELPGDKATALPLGDGPRFDPVGRTDSERILCWLLGVLEERGARRLADVGWDRLHEWFRHLNDLGPCNLMLSDGIDLVVYQDRRRLSELFWLQRPAPQSALDLRSDDVTVRLTGDTARQRSSIVVSSVPLSADPWRPMAGGQLLVLRSGSLLWDSHAGECPELGPAPPMPRRLYRPEPRVLSVVHETTYRYGYQVERSTHLLKLAPLRDLTQTPLEHEVTISVPSLRHEFEDVFGNRTTAITVETPFYELKVTSRSLVRVAAPAPLELSGPRRVSLPLVWMPWQRQMMSPYLLPPELSESELRILIDYALGFARRQDNDLVETLCDMNVTIHRDFAYMPGETHIDTTPFEFFERRRGVCQDFANLLICLARLLNIPARYRVGYLYTGADYANKLQSEASHAWVELYLPDHGWHGFDPTNGCLVGTDHVRVAAGRHYRDAAPIAGTIYAGGGIETLDVRVRVELGEEPVPDAAIAGAGMGPGTGDREY
jgi:transglutaminase-like putative cysteine protease/predicted glutamine amidotransferase